MCIAASHDRALLRKRRAATNSVSLPFSRAIDGFLLVKCGDRTVQVWRPRFFKFQQGTLTCWSSDTDSAKLLRKDAVLDASLSNVVQNGLRIKLANGRALYLSATSRDQAKAWRETLSSYAIIQRKAKDLSAMKALKSMQMAPIVECDCEDSCECQA